jgi:branched-chain amino acid aminotransferase
MHEMNTIWQNGQSKKWDEAQTHALTHSLHYGSAVFEGIRSYQTSSGPAIFKLKEHIDRFMYSAGVMGMQMPYNKQEICQAIIDTAQENNLTDGYIRPLAYYGYGTMKVGPDKDLPIDVIIACWPCGDYLSVNMVDITISPYIRIHPKSTVADAKISGHYVNSILTGIAIRNTHYHESILLDLDGYVAEGSTANIFIIKDNKIITTPEGTILMGITRKTVIQMANELCIPVEERLFKPEEVHQADEAFFCGTAFEITAIRSLDDNIIGNGEIGPISAKIKNRYHQIIHGEDDNYNDALTWVPAIAN